MCHFICVYDSLSTNLALSVFKELGYIPSVPILQTLPVFGSGVAMFPLSHIFDQSFLNSFLAINPIVLVCDAISSWLSSQEWILVRQLL